jgi:isopentenyl-diphosphate delta-isomerase
MNNETGKQMQKVILVDRNDREIGLEEKIKAHREGKLHRAVSVYIFNSEGQLMVQRRAKDVYHSGSLWSNTCCTNCYEGESADFSAHRSLKNEMGFDCNLEEAFSIIYKTPVGNGLTENEFLHVFFGRYDKDPVVNRKEVMDWKWISFGELVRDVKANGKNYSAWLGILINDELPMRVRKFLSGKG